MSPRLLIPFFAFAAMTATAADFEVSSPDLPGHRFAPNLIANGFGCSGGNQSPQIVWRNPPAGTQSFMVTMYDQDAPTGSGYWHWVIANLPPDTTQLPRGAGSQPDALPAGTLQISNDTGQPGYLGPCPPVGESHRYLITVIALKTARLDVPPGVTPATAGFVAHFATLGKASYTATWSR
ncbi:YbhB/YbcL family Raf kinase inhibitor-like protein [Amantichitinum ursilacus]|uniref:Putative kinase inhibitor protein n=1 Tax=Amantichitinum ursilacus TaxID=857265 RepID=A0A0N0GQ56_9NEIS|nr:YbhB/YbcL family Raf kinase inhibitor-like protein [Amantichitinum ursilacus]KPC54312.1 putative kinase inhibitor protein [Amantichitinum ursilacus]